MTCIISGGFGSFGGVAFRYSSASVSGGRRIVTHEYPGIADQQHYLEDMTSEPKRYSVSGYLTGPNLRQRQYALEKALSAKGAGEFFDPWLNRYVMVRCERFGFNTGVDNLSQVHFTAEFIREGADPAPHYQEYRYGALPDAVDALKRAALSQVGDYTPEEWQAVRGYVRNSYLLSPQTQPFIVAADPEAVAEQFEHIDSYQFHARNAAMQYEGNGLGAFVQGYSLARLAETAPEGGNAVQISARREEFMALADTMPEPIRPQAAHVRLQADAAFSDRLSRLEPVRQYTGPQTNPVLVAYQIYGDPAYADSLMGLGGSLSGRLEVGALYVDHQT